MARLAKTIYVRVVKDHGGSPDEDYHVVSESMEDHAEIGKDILVGVYELKETGGVATTIGYTTNSTKKKKK